MTGTRRCARVSDGCGDEKAAGAGADGYAHACGAGPGPAQPCATRAARVLARRDRSANRLRAACAVAGLSKGRGRMATTQTGVAVAGIADIEHGDVNDGRVRHRVRDHFGIEGFGVNAFRAVEAGGLLINEHDELGIGAPGQQELYVVLSGKARFTIDGDEIEAPAGTLVYVGPDAKRGAVADEKDTTVLVVGGSPGMAYNQS